MEIGTPLARTKSFGRTMQGSLAIWYDGAGDQPCDFEPNIELHFNIWKDLPGNVGALDIGLQLKDIRTVSRINIFVPGDFDISYVEDLSSQLKDNDTLAAVFNELYHLGPEHEQKGFDVLNDKGQRVLRVLSTKESDLSVRNLRSEEVCEGTILSIDSKLFSTALQEVGDHYIRLRLFLRDNLRKLFVTREFSKGIAYIPSFSIIDTVEFRLNEKRNLTKVLMQHFPKMSYPKISTIQYFLITNRRTEIIRSHENFRKMRLLEPGLWDKYLSSLGNIKADDLLIYQWRKSDEKSGVDDFIALAMFRTEHDNTLKYFWIVLLAGAIGSTLSTITIAVLGKLMTWLGIDSAKSPVLTTAMSCLVLVVSFFLLAIWVRRRVEKA